MGRLTLAGATIIEVAQQKTTVRFVALRIVCRLCALDCAKIASTGIFNTPNTPNTHDTPNSPFFIYTPNAPKIPFAIEQAQQFYYLTILRVMTFAFGAHMQAGENFRVL